MWRLIRELVRPYRGTLMVILSAMLAETAMSLAAPWPLKIIIDNVVGHHRLTPWLDDIVRPMLEGGQKMQVAAFAALATLLIAVIGAVASYIDNYYTESVGQWVAHDLRMRTYHHLQRLSLGYYNTHQTGALLSTITTDIQTIQGFASSSSLDIFVDLFTILSMLGLMFWLNWDFTLIALGITPFLLLFVSRFKKAVKKATHEVRKDQGEIVAVVQQDLESMHVITAFGRQELQQKQLQDVSQATVAAALRARRIKSLLSPVVTITVAACTAVVLWRGAWLIVHDMMTVGELTVFLAYLSKFFKPVKDLATMTNQIAQAAVGVERVRTILDTDAIIEEKPDAIDPGPLTGAIEFQNVAFGYDAEAPVLKDVNLKIEPGQFIGIVGPTGAGKSTIVSLIPRFYDPLSGVVRVDGKDLRDVKLKELRDQIGYVLQDTVLFRGTVAENIAFGRPDATTEEIVAAAKLANADEFIAKMSDGYNTMVGERGVTLSGGQRQRIGIARVMVRKSPILLLDEPTAALDTESEHLVIDALERLMKGKTVITIAHRLSTIRDADRILVICDGIVAEAGTHNELLALGGIFAGLYHAQFKDETTRSERALPEQPVVSASLKSLSPEGA
ncbi:ABC transporter ATP-binding protein [Alloacidobacterium dinghuense]|uniref:ABC transporter ATP-binding protein n=1 Tax=Alloacidobacterium dinghuense TaxID=2763107 RepID=A0A7G8BMB7_9BACT|nr:ABC transporter ATP-binding protein [Alloacidobacterium dinghuense]QNI33687.1 ABC transporter ATP-binding protein [Alloacidobacterium dinghuense]